MPVKTSEKTETLVTENDAQQDNDFPEHLHSFRQEGQIHAHDIPQISVEGREHPSGHSGETVVSKDNLELMDPHDIIPGTSLTAGEVLELADSVYNEVISTRTGTLLSSDEVNYSPELQDATLERIDKILAPDQTHAIELQALADELTSANGLSSVKVFVLDSDGIGGIAVGNGVIGVTQGMIKDALEEGNGMIDPTSEKGAALVGVLAHEIAHADLRHKEVGDQIKAEIKERLGEGNASPEMANLVQNYVSREIERAADQMGINIIDSAFSSESTVVLEQYEKFLREVGLFDLGSEPNSKPWPDTHHPRYTPEDRIKPYKNEESE